MLAADKLYLEGKLARGESTMKRRKKMMNKHKVRKRRRAQRLKSSARRD